MNDQPDPEAVSPDPAAISRWRSLQRAARQASRDAHVAWTLLLQQSEMDEATEGDIDILCQDYGRAKLAEHNAEKAVKAAYPFWVKAPS